MTTTILTLSLLLFAGTMVNAQELRGCQNCIHLNMEIFNMPILYKSLFEATLSDLQHANQDCVDGTAQTETCSAHSLSDLRGWKCQAITMTITAHGLGTVFPGAVMVTSLTMRNCIQGETSSENHCMGVETQGVDFLQYIHEMTGTFNQQWNNITTDGEICRTSPQSMNDSDVDETRL